MSDPENYVSEATDTAHNTDATPKTTVNDLIKNLRLAAEIEQQFMCMYLYGAYSVKKRYVEGQFEDPGCNHDALPAEDLPNLEVARRWVSEIYSVARQEMEHLALVNNMLRAVGAAPCFARQNIQDINKDTDHIWKMFSLSAEGDPVVESSGEFMTTQAFKQKFASQNAPPPCQCFKPIEFDFKFTHFDLDAAKAWTCMEAPGYKALKQFGPELFADWCFSCSDNIDTEDPKAGSYAGKISELYEEIRAQFSQLQPSDYVVPSEEQVSILQQYDIFVFPVTDYASASQAIDLILTQGEGNEASVDYQSHYRRFFEIVKHYPQNSAPLYWDLIENPCLNEIDSKYSNTRELFELSNKSYDLLVIILTALYALPQNPSAAPYLAPALKQEAFAPMMTMIIRSLSELLVQLKANDQDQRVASSFEISPEVHKLLLYPYVGMHPGNANQVFKDPKLKDELGNLNNILARFADFNNQLQAVELKDTDIANSSLIDWAKNRLAYIKENSQRIQVNLSRINQTGIYSLLDSGE